MEFYKIDPWRWKRSLLSAGFTSGKETGVVASDELRQFIRSWTLRAILNFIPHPQW
jgi:hypothetical protein